MNAAFVLLGAALIGQPVAKIVGPQSAPPGDLVVLDGSGSGARDFAWRLVGSDKTILPVDNGQRCVFASGTPGVYRFVLAVAAGDKVDIATHELTIGNAPPTPPVPPGPVPPGPVPPTPPAPPTPPEPGKYGLNRFVFDEAMKLDPAARVKAVPLASGLKGIASAIMAGGLRVAQIPGETRKAWDTAIGDQKPAWTPVDARLQAELKKLAAASKITSVEQLAEAYVEIATGLEAVK